MFLRHTAPAWLWALLILFLCGLPGNEIPEFDLIELLNADKIAHAALFGTQVLLTAIGLKKQYTFGKLRFRGVSVAFTFGVVYGVLTEVLQLLVFSNRHFDFLDVIANTIGCFIGIIFFYLIYGRR